MTGFMLIAVVMTAAAVCCIVIPIARSHRNEESSPGIRQANLSILRDQLAELQADLGSGTLSQEQYRTAYAEVERRALEEGADDRGTPMASGGNGRWWAPAVAMLIPVSVLGLYLLIGQPEGMRAEAVSGEQHLTEADVEEMVARLAARLEKNPDDPKGWMMLARSYYVLQRMPEASAAYAKAAEKLQGDADLLADYADALAVSQGRSIGGKPLELVRQALKINPTQPKALAMAGTEAFYRQDYAGALAYWEKLLPLLPPESEMGKSVAGGIAEARDLMGKPANRSAASPKAESKPSASASASVTGKVTLSPGLAAKTSPQDTLFIVARAVDGPRIPLAVLRKRAGDLPLNFTLDDTLAMSPELKLSGFQEVIVSARISKSGNAIAQPGDLQGFTKPVKVGAQGIAVNIDTVVP
jgi:cytochrome c-type biogenesis protein CcmH